MQHRRFDRADTPRIGGKTAEYDVCMALRLGRLGAGGHRLAKAMEEYEVCIDTNLVRLGAGGLCFRIRYAGRCRGGNCRPTLADFQAGVGGLALESPYRDSRFDRFPAHPGWRQCYT